MPGTRYVTEQWARPSGKLEPGHDDLPDIMCFEFTDRGPRKRLLGSLCCVRERQSAWHGVGDLSDESSRSGRAEADSETRTTARARAHPPFLPFSFTILPVHPSRSRLTTSTDMSLYYFRQPWPSSHLLIIPQTPSECVLTPRWPFGSRNPA